MVKVSLVRKARFVESPLEKKTWKNRIKKLKPSKGRFKRRLTKKRKSENLVKSS